MHHAGGTTVVSKDLRETGGTWRLLGTFEMDPGQGHKVVLSDDASNTLTADAIAFDGASQSGDQAVWTLVELSGYASGPVSADAVAIESATSSPGNQSIWTLPLTIPDKYDVYARWGSNDSGASTAKYVVTHAGGTDTVTMNQNNDAGYWKKLGTYDLAPSAGHKVNLSDRTNGVVQADAIRLVSVEGVERIARWQGTVANAGTYQVWARWPAAPTHTFAASYDIVTPSGTQTAIVNQRIEGGRWHLLKTVTLAANDNWKVELSDQSPGEVVADAVAITAPLTITDRFDWSPTLPSAGDYAVYAKWQAADDRANDATYEVTHSGGVATVAVDQRHNGSEWRYLGTWSFDPSQSPKVSLLASLNGTVNADAVRFVSGDAIGGEIAYSHGDQLGTIQKLTDASGTLVWDRIARPFGETVSINAASGIEQKLRFAGQFADETGLSYNYFRDYDATLGRYAQSDPIGLNGGVNTYAYVGGNPLNYTDPTGELVDVILDIGFIIYDLYRIGKDNVFDDCDNLGENLAALGADVGAAFIPFATGAGLGVRAIKGVDELSQAGKALDKGGELTKAGRAAQKHGSRPGSAFPPTKGNPQSINQQGQNALDDILTSPGQSSKTNRFGGQDITAPDGRGARFDADGNFMGFLEP